MVALGQQRLVHLVVALFSKLAVFGSHKSLYLLNVLRKNFGMIVADDFAWFGRRLIWQCSQWHTVTPAKPGSRTTSWPAAALTVLQLLNALGDESRMIVLGDDARLDGEEARQSRTLHTKEPAARSIARPVAA